MGIFLTLLLTASAGQQEPPQNSPNKAGPTVRFEVLIADLAEPAAEPTAASILELEKTGKLRSLMRLQVAALDQQSASVQIGEIVPRANGQIVAGRRGGPGFAAPAPAQRFTDLNVGTTMNVTPRIENDGSIAAQLMIFRTGLADRQQPAADAEPVPLAQAVDRLTVETTLHLQVGEPQLISAKQNRAGKESETTWIVVTAHLGPPAKAPAAK